MVAKPSGQEFSHPDDVSKVALDVVNYMTLRGVNKMRVYYPLTDVGKCVDAVGYLVFVPAKNRASTRHQYLDLKINYPIGSPVMWDSIRRTTVALSLSVSL